MNDMALIREYSDRDSESAFADLVNRHIHLVYSVAFRYVGNSPDAQDVTQAVFVILAKKAASLRQRATITGWLYETTRFTAAALLRTKARQQARDQEAYMQSTLNDSGLNDVWRQLAPILEDAMNHLNEKERALLALRFFENNTAAETSALLGIQEAAAHKRVARALEKLRRFFLKRGIDSTTEAIAGAISTSSVQAAPMALAKSVIAVAVAKGAAASGSTLTLIKGALKLMAWTKAKTVVVAGAVLILAAGTTTVIVKNSTHLSRVKLQRAPSEKDMFEAGTSKRINEAHISARACFRFADEHQNQWPTNFAQLNAEYPESSLSDSNWEFVSGGDRSSFTNSPETILFREKEPRRSPDGSFVKVYAFADWSVQVLSSTDDDFTALEKQRGYVIQRSEKGE